MPYVTQFPVRLVKQTGFHLISLSVCVLNEASSDVIQDQTRYKSSRFEVCLGFAIGSLSKHRLCLTHACLIHFLGMFAVIGSVSVCGMI